MCEGKCSRGCSQQEVKESPKVDAIPLAAEAVAIITTITEQVVSLNVLLDELRAAVGGEDDASACPCEASDE
jgi:hypothetical protein